MSIKMRQHSSTSRKPWKKHFCDLVKRGLPTNMTFEKKKEKKLFMLLPFPVACWISFKFGFKTMEYKTFDNNVGLSSFCAWLRISCCSLDMKINLMWNYFLLTSNWTRVIAFLLIYEPIFILLSGTVLWSFQCRKLLYGFLWTTVANWITSHVSSEQNQAYLISQNKESSVALSAYKLLKGL